MRIYINLRLDVSIYSNVYFMLLIDIMSDVITTIFHKQVVDLSSHQLSSLNYKLNAKLSKLTTPLIPRFKF